MGRTWKADKAEARFRRGRKTNKGKGKEKQGWKARLREATYSDQKS